MAAPAGGGYRARMHVDDDIPVPKEPEGIPRNLEPLSVDALRQYLVELGRERGRVEEEIARRGGAQKAAESVFRKP